MSKENAGSASGDLDLGTYKRRTQETRQTYEVILAFFQETFGDQPREVLCGAVDEVLGTLRSETVREKKAESSPEDVIEHIEAVRRLKADLAGTIHPSILGPLPDERFALLTNLGEKITDFALPEEKAGGDPEGLDETYGVNVELEDSDEEGRGDDVAGDIGDDSEADSEEGGVEAVHEGEMAGTELGDEEDSAAGLKPRDVDAYWLQRSLAKFEEDPAQAQQKAKDVLGILKEAADDRDCENKLVLLLGLDAFQLIKTLRAERQMILHCTLLAQAQSDEERAALEAEMGAEPELAACLQDLEDLSFAQGSHLMSNKRCHLPGSFRERRWRRRALAPADYDEELSKASELAQAALNWEKLKKLYKYRHSFGEPNDSRSEEAASDEPKLVGKYLFGEVLGEDAYGRVMECLDSHSLARRAAKIMKKSKLRRISGGPEIVATELRLLARLHHPNVIRLVETFERPEEGKLYVVMEFCVMSLEELTLGAPLKRLPLWQAHGYFRQLVDGLQYIHSQGVVHKDVRPGNLLLAVDESVKISDFGVAEEFDLHSGSDKSHLGTLTPKFQAPEIASGKSRSFHAFLLDCWSSGVTLYWLTTGEYPFDAESILELYENIVQQPLVLPDLLDEDPALQAILRELLEKDPRKRLSVDGMKGHAWLRLQPPGSRHGKVSMESVKPSAGEVTSVYPELVAMIDDDDATAPPGPSQDLLAESQADSVRKESSDTGLKKKKKDKCKLQ